MRFGAPWFEVEPSSEVEGGDRRRCLVALVVHLVGAVDAHDAVGAAPMSKSAVAGDGVDDHGVGRGRPSKSSVGRRGR